MSIESAIEEKIKQAIARGEFDNLAGKGKPLDLDAYFNTPEHLRMGYSILKSNDFVPEEIEMLREIGNLRTLLKDSAEEAEKDVLSKKLNEKSLALTLILERNKRK